MPEPTDYRGNSDKLKTATNPVIPEKNLEKVVSGDVVVKRRGVGERFKGIFFGGDMTTAREYVVDRVVLPALRDLVVNSITKGVDRLVYGDAAPRRSPPTYQPRVSYHNPLYQREPLRGALPDRPIERWASSRRTLDDVILASRNDADAVVEQLITVVEKYEQVSVADLYELLGLPMDSIDYKWGWTNLATISTRQVREGYQIVLPALEEL